MSRMKAERVGLLLSSADEAPRLKVVSPIPTSEAADKLEQSKEANTAENEPVPEPEVVQVSLGPLKVVSLEVTQARLTWEEPVYLPKSQADPDQLPLKCARFEVDWAQLDSPNSTIKDGDWKPLPSGDVDVHEVQVAGLRPGTTYAVRVRPIVDTTPLDKDQWVVHASPSPPAVFTTHPSAPSQMKPPLLVSRDRRELKVKWNPPDEPGGANMPLTYQLFMAPPPQDSAVRPDEQGYVCVYKGPERAFKATKLVPGSRYNFWVLATNTVGTSPQGQVAVCSTQATVPSQPEPPRVVSATQSSLTVTWAPPPSNGSAITAYTLERDDGGPPAAQALPGPGAGGPFMLAYAGPATSAVVSGLRPGLAYRFRVRATNDEGFSHWSEPLVATTGASPPGPPAALELCQTTQTSATVAWQLPTEHGGAPAVVHEVELQAVSRAAAEVMGTDWLKVFEGTATACGVMSLRPGCVYRLRVRSANSAGWGSWCLPLQVTTGPDVPDAPGAPAILEGGTTNLTLTWHPPLHNGGLAIAAYQLELQALPGSTFLAPVLAQQAPLPAAQQAQQQNGGRRTGRNNQQGATAEKQGAQQGQQQQQQAEVPPQQQQQAVLVTAEGGAMVVYRGPENIAKVDGLQPGGAYQFRVQAINPQGAGAWSSWAVLGTSPDVPAVPQPPVQAGPAAAGALTLKWPVPESRGAQISGYILQMAVRGRVTSAGVLVPAAQQQPLLQQQEGEAGAEEAAGQQSQQLQLKWQQVYKGAVPSAEVSGLAPSSRYAFRVAAVNAVGNSVFSQPADLTTAPAAPTEPLSVTATPVSSSEIQITWAPPVCDQGSPLTGYTVDMAPVKGDNGAAAGAWQQVGSVPAGPAALQGSDQHGPSMRFCNLQPGRSYQFRVRALNSCGSSPASTPAQATTLAAPPGAPCRLSVTQKAATHARIKWDLPQESHGAPVEEYHVEVLCPAPPVALHLSTPVQHPGSPVAPSSAGTVQYAASTQQHYTDGMLVPAEGLKEHQAHNHQDMLLCNGNGIAHTLPGSLCSSNSSSSGDTPVVNASTPLKGCSPRTASQNGSVVHANHHQDGSMTPAAAASGPYWRTAYMGSDLSAKVTDLEPGTKYQVRVSARNSAGWGPACAAEGFRTALAPPGPPESLEVLIPGTQILLASSSLGRVSHEGSAAATAAAGAAPGSLLVRWQPPVPTPVTAAAATYEVATVLLPLLAAPANNGTNSSAPAGQLQQQGGQHSEGGHHSLSPAGPTAVSSNTRSTAGPEVKVNAGKSTEFVLEKLAPGKRYAVRVRAVGAEGAGHGTWSGDLEVIVPGAPCGSSASSTVAGHDAEASVGGAEVVLVKGKKGASKKGGAGGAGGNSRAASAAAGKGGSVTSRHPHSLSAASLNGGASADSDDHQESTNHSSSMAKTASGRLGSKLAAMPAAQPPKLTYSWTEKPVARLKSELRRLKKGVKKNMTFFSWVTIIGVFLIAVYINAILSILPAGITRPLGGLPLQQYSGPWVCAVLLVVLLLVGLVALLDHFLWQRFLLPIASRPTKSQAKRSKGGK